MIACVCVCGAAARRLHWHPLSLCCLSVFSKKKMKKYDWKKHLDSVPHLPLPDLSETLARYLHYVESISTEEEFANAVIAVRDFARNDGPSLHEDLKRRRERQGTSSSYVKPFWDDTEPVRTILCCF